jgi:hypothetical protein
VLDIFEIVDEVGYAAQAEAATDEEGPDTVKE